MNMNGQNKMGMRFMTPAHQNIIPNYSLIIWKLCEIIVADVLAFLQSSDLQSRSRSIRLESKYWVHYYVSAYRL